MSGEGELGPGSASKGKRKGGYQQGGGGDRKRTRRDFPRGSRGWLLTVSTPGKGREATKELITLLQDFLPPADEEAAGGEAGGVSAALASELSDMRTQIKQFVPIYDVVKSAHFLRLDTPQTDKESKDQAAEMRDEDEDEIMEIPDEEDDSRPSELAWKLFDRTVNTKVANSRFINRLLPIDYICRPHMENFTRLARQLIPRHFTPAPAKPQAEEGKADGESAAVAAPPPPSAPESFCTWKCEFNARSMKTIARKDVYAAIEELIDKRHKVNLTNPDRTILVEVNPRFCGVSVLREWSRFEGYNLGKLLGTVPKTHLGNDVDKKGGKAEKGGRMDVETEDAAAPVQQPGEG
ncbi:unnamed protein product [Vitrella brassicaformis CCMP3155]|uniref:THUMP domain-containing protein n=2 Tax=Vitrella brassicaformis TaxID=1169539 RepID=A0A0G4E8C6_VITBC|nr:unnamed protein product [Vitrella brassicaformis CCMP3155]|eukprot:CEL91679.1 unnamed protein product [Vitrella brassicaformis CCMP3155]